MVYALGSSSNGAALPGLAEYGFTLSSLESALATHERLRQLESPSAVIGGGGLTAIELAAEIAEAWPRARVTLVPGNALQPSGAPGGFRPEAMVHIRGHLERAGVSIADGQRAEALEAGRVLLQGGAGLAAGIYIHACGFSIPGLAARSGLETEPGGRIVVDAALRSVSHPRLFAVGDCAAPSTREGRLARLSCATALPMGVAAARNIVALARGKSPEPHYPGYSVRNVSLGRNDGLIQFLDDEDRPLNYVWTGKKAAHWKEYICQTTLRAIRFEKEPSIPYLPPLLRIPHLVKHARAVA